MEEEDLNSGWLNHPKTAGLRAEQSKKLEALRMDLRSKARMSTDPNVRAAEAQLAEAEVSYLVLGGKLVTR